MLSDLVSDIEVYGTMIDLLPRYKERAEVAEIFIRRELIDAALGETAASETVVHQLDEADAKLLGHRSLLLRRFPEVFRLRAPNIPRRYWWWYLDEGPQVREEALAATREP
ncbi:MAG: hypothetical protein HYU88_07485 [Chloroflexi bacterium]|nr:hypothetical protein [Chloroflexota bacterium]MBI4507773.1 hypothetical protein [Chloroflexota bacterium]